MIIAANRLAKSAKPHLPCIIACCWLVMMLLLTCVLSSKITFFALADEGIVVSPDKQQILDEARQAASSRDAPKAVKLYSTFLESYPNHQGALRALGELQMVLGRYQEADTTYSRLLIADQDDPAVITQLGTIKFYLKKRYEAQALLSGALASPRLNEEQKTQANKVLGEIYSDWSVLAAMQKREDFAGQERFLTYHINKSPETAATEYGLRGLARQRLHKNKEALQDYTRALEIDGLSEDMAASITRSKSLLEAAAGREGQDDESATLSPGPAEGEEERRMDHWQTILTNIQVLENKGDYAGLDSYLATLFGSEQTRVFAAVKRANLRIKRGAYNEAEEDLNYAAANSPDERAKADIKRSRQLLANARAGWTQPTVKPAKPEQGGQPSWAEIRTRVTAYEEAKDREGLINYISSLVQYDSTRHYALIKRAYIRIYSNDFAGAASDLDAASKQSASDKARQDVETAREHLTKRIAEYEKREAARKAQARKPKAGKAPARSALSNPYVTFKRVNQYLQKGEYEKAERSLGALRPRSLRRPEQGIYAFYRSELAFHAGKKEEALAGYHRAARQVTNAFWLTSVNMRLAQIYADKKDAENAVKYVERAVALSPDQAWRMQQAARIYLNLQMPEHAAEYYRRSLELDSSPKGAAGAYQGLADIYKRLQDMTRYLEYAAIYVSELSTLSEPLESHQESTVEYFRAELRKASGNAKEAIPNYLRAANLTTERYRLSEIHHKLAECYADIGDYEQAAMHAEKSAELLADQGWVIRRSAGIFRRIDMLDRAIEYTRRALEIDPEAPASSYQSLALLYLSYGDRDSFSQFNMQYIDLLTQEIEALGPLAPDELRQRLYDARWMQTRGTKVWGFNSYHYGFRNAREHYYYGMTNELYRNYRLPNGWSGKAYLHIKGTPTAYYDGNYYNQYSKRKGKWRARRHLDDSLHGIVGTRVRPFSFLPHLSVGPELLFPLGHHHMDSDFRLRAVYFRNTGKTPRLFGYSWPYAQAYGDLIYSTRDNDFIMYGHLRYGRTFVRDCNRNFLIIPYAGLNWSYSGQDASKGKQWGLEGGPEIMFSFWFDEDKYHAPQRSVDVGFYYHWGISHGVSNAVGFNVSLSF